MDLLQMLGGQQRRQEYDDFINRYDQGAPWDGIGDDEAYQRYNEVAPHVPEDVYEESAYEAFSRMSPQQRRQLAQYLRTQARDQGYAAQFPDLDNDGIDDRFERDPRLMAQTMRRIHAQQPGMFPEMIGGGRGFGGQMRGQQRRRQQRKKQSSPLDSPIAKAALAGIAAIAAKKMLGR